VQNKEGVALSLKHFFLPKNNHWLKRTLLILTFVLYDYLSTLIFCQEPQNEANIYARIFMENFGIPIGLTMFVLMANLPIYMVLSLDSHIIRLPSKTAIVAESFVDIIFAWFVAGFHFSGGSSWFWNASSLTHQIIGAFLYLSVAFLVVKPYKPCYGD